MFNENEILTRLQNGESIDDIAKSVTDVLNKANTSYKNQKAKEEADRRAAELETQRERQLKAKKVQEMKKLVAGFNNYMQMFYPDVMNDSALMDDEDVANLVDTMDKEIHGMNELKSLLNDLSNMFEPSKSKGTNSADEIADFLARKGW